MESNSMNYAWFINKYEKFLKGLVFQEQGVVVRDYRIVSLHGEFVREITEMFRQMSYCKPDMISHIHVSRRLNYNITIDRWEIYTEIYRKGLHPHHCHILTFSTFERI